MERPKIVMTGADAAAEAMRQINPDVVPAYPITPQTPIMHKFAEFIANGLVNSEFLSAESEHSAMSAAVGAAAAGGRVMTATSSQGLALMWEIVYIAASNRLPIIMNVVNRALSGPINIHCDHSDTMGTRDSGWIQLYSENAEEVYENNILAVKLAETVKLPVMVCQDGFITSHALETLRILDDKTVKKFIGEYNPKHWLLDVDHPITSGPFDFYDYYFEHKRQQIDAMSTVMANFKRIAKELGAIIGKKIEPIETYRMNDANFVILSLNSTAGTVKHTVDVLRAKGRRVGALKLRLFRPFPVEELSKALAGKKVLAVFDRAASFGHVAPLYQEVRSALYDIKNKPKVVSYIYGLGGRDLTQKLVEKAFAHIESGKIKNENYLGVRDKDEY